MIGICKNAANQLTFIGVLLSPPPSMLINDLNYFSENSNISLRNPKTPSFPRREDKKNKKKNNSDRKGMIISYKVKEIFIILLELSNLYEL